MYYSTFRPHKDGSGGDRVSVTWRKAGEPASKNGDPPIGGEFLERPVELPPDGTATAAEWAIADGRTREAVVHLAALSADNPDDTLLAMKVAAAETGKEEYNS